jgi:hypothetical protein
MVPLGCNVIKPCRTCFDLDIDRFQARTGRVAQTPALQGWGPVFKPQYCQKSTFQCFIFVSTGVWTLGLALARKVLYHLNHTPTLFTVVIFQIGSCSFCSGRSALRSCLSCLLHGWDDRHVPPHPAFFVEMDRNSFLTLALSYNPTNLCLPGAGILLRPGVIM